MHRPSFVCLFLSAALKTGPATCLHISYSISCLPDILNYILHFFTSLSWLLPLTQLSLDHTLERVATVREMGLVAEVELLITVILSLVGPIMDTTGPALNAPGTLLAPSPQLISVTQVKGTRALLSSAGINLDVETSKGVAEVDPPVGVSQVILLRTDYTPKLLILLLHLTNLLLLLT